MLSRNSGPSQVDCKKRTVCKNFADRPKRRGGCRKSECVLQQHPEETAVIVVALAITL
jgi:hypothetical protein